MPGPPLGNKNAQTHGMRHWPEYPVWQTMIARCCKEYHKSFKKYGGSGIHVCQRWRRSFPNFISDMGRRPGPGYTIERLNNSRGYTPKNCRWATHKEQAWNRSTSLMIRIGRECKSLGQWCHELNLKRDTIHKRIYKGMDPRTALNMPIRAWRRQN